MSSENKEKPVVFDEKTHTYRHRETGELLMSASQLLKAYSEPFDADGSILKRCAERDGVSVQEMSAQWDKKRIDAANRGTSFHRQVEHFIKTGEILPEDDEDIVKEFAKMKFTGRLKSEVMLWDLEYMIAGTADLIEVFPDNSINLRDFKTSREIKRNAFFGKGKPPKKLLYPLHQRHDCNYEKFCLQLSIYGYLLDKRGYWIRNLEVLWINPKSREIEVIPIEYRRKEIIRLLEHFKPRRQELLSKIGLDIDLDLE